MKNKIYRTDELRNVSNQTRIMKATCVSVSNAIAWLRASAAGAASLLLPLLLTRPSPCFAFSSAVHIRHSPIAFAPRGDLPPGLDSGCERGCGLRLAVSPADPDKVMEGLTVGAILNFKMWAMHEIGILTTNQ